MNIFVATVGELVIVELCVLWIWLKVLLDSLKSGSAALDHRRLLLTSIGLVFNSVAITGIMAFRLVEYLAKFWPFVPGIVACYILLATGNIMFIISAAIGSPNARTLKVFILVTTLWTLACFIMYNLGLDLKL